MTTPEKPQDQVKVKVTLGDLVASSGVLQELGSMAGMPQKVAFRLARVIRKSTEDVKLYNERHTAILRATGKISPHPGIAGQFWLDPKVMTLEDNEKLKREMDELSAEVVEIDAWPIKAADFGERVDLRPNWLATLHWLITEE